MPVKADPPPFGECCICDLKARVWYFDEEVVPLGAGLSVVQSWGVCRVCLKLLVREATRGVDDQPLRNA
jgi:hypothetical protein